MPIHRCEQPAEMLLDLKRLADALNENDVSMHATPKRLRGLYGAAKAADRVQDKQKAQFYYGAKRGHGPAGATCGQAVSRPALTDAP